LLANNLSKAKMVNVFNPMIQNELTNENASLALGRIITSRAKAIKSAQKP
jgi:hypothetical protein